MYARALHTLQQATAFTALGCGGSDRFKSNLLKKGKGNHYGWVQNADLCWISSSSYVNNV